MRKLVLALTTAAMLSPATVADARHYYHRHYYRGYKVCRHSSGTTGLVAGGVGGGLLGHAVLGGVGGTLVGVAGGALGGRAIDRSMTAHRRCYYR
jgi:outer membrane lipoprotein SlyB